MFGFYVYAFFNVIIFWYECGLYRYLWVWCGYRQKFLKFLFIYLKSSNNISAPEVLITHF